VFILNKNLLYLSIGAEQGNFESFESLDHWKCHFQSLLFSICSYRPPFLCVKTFLIPPVYKGKTLFPPPLHLPTTSPLPINNDHSLSGMLLLGSRINLINIYIDIFLFYCCINFNRKDTHKVGQVYG
jgi:hypothetical protein